MVTVGTRLRIIRKDAGLSQVELGQHRTICKRHFSEQQQP